MENPGILFLVSIPGGEVKMTEDHQIALMWARSISSRYGGQELTIYQVRIESRSTFSSATLTEVVR